jgi:hypothetical protein
MNIKKRANGPGTRNLLVFFIGNPFEFLNGIAQGIRVAVLSLFLFRSKVIYTKSLFDSL